MVNDFQQRIAILFPELGNSAPDLEQFASSIIVRTLNLESEPLIADMVEHYGMDCVRAVAQDRADRLDGSVYRRWREPLALPERSAMVDRFHRMWRP